MTITIDGGAGITFPDTVQQTNGMTMTGGNPLYYAARAWVNFNGTGTVAIRAAVNVSSIADLGTGEYRVNMATAMPDANYAVIATRSRTAGGSTNGAVQVPDGGTFSSSAVELICESSNGSNEDANYVLVAIFR